MPAKRSLTRCFGFERLMAGEAIESISISETACNPIFPTARLVAMKLTTPHFPGILAVLLFVLPAAVALHAQDWAKARLEASPRHHEYVPLKHGSRTVQAFVVYPEVKSKAPVVVLIHEMHELGIDPVFWDGQDAA